jgi:hypothetical protein
MMMPMRDSGSQDGFLRISEAEIPVCLKQALLGIERKSLGIFRIEVKQRMLLEIPVGVFNKELTWDLPTSL